MIQRNPVATSTADREIVVTRVFDAPRALVFKAWTDPKLVAAWWGPKGYASSGCEIDLRPGGTFRLHMRGPEGIVYPCQGAFREIVEPERIVYVGVLDDGPACGAGLPPHSIVTVTFAEHRGKTTLTIHTHLHSVAAHAAVVGAGFNAGWATSLERLAEHLAKA
jgi:uncharacterized protein YndB with AHSA1/START domain